MPTPRSPCRLFVYLAKEAPLAVILRRGPSAWVRLSLWHTATDTFEHGQWMHNRVYEQRCDLSADGASFVYFARRSSGPSQSNQDTWVAVSRPPLFTALALWFVGGTYYTGGYFLDGQLWLGFDQVRPDIGQVPLHLRITTALPPYLDQTNEWTNRTVWLNRLLRDGWERVSGAQRETWQRKQPGSTNILMMSWPVNSGAQADRSRMVEYALLRPLEGEMIPLGAGSWADWDQQGRLVIARDGRLAWGDRLGRMQEILDFNSQDPDPRPVPEVEGTGGFR